MMRRRTKRVREGQVRERKKEGKPAYFGAHVEKTRLRMTGLVKSEKATGRSSYTTAKHSTLKTREAQTFLANNVSHAENNCCVS